MATEGLRDISADSFTEFFEAGHGQPPYRWQTRLAEQVMETDQWPERIDLPAGCGKSAVLDIALFCMARDPMRFPRRIVFVANRRLAVSDINLKAMHLRDKIAVAETGVLADVKHNLQAIAGTDHTGDLIDIAMMKGGVPRQEWASINPCAPSVWVATADKFGSRLLFSGYGVSDDVRSIHAGLAGNDCLVILDELHLGNAFGDTVRSLPDRNMSRVLPDRWQVVELSNTHAGDIDGSFALTPQDYSGRSPASKALSKLMSARKKVQLVSMTRNNPVADIMKLIKGYELPKGSIGIIVNRVASAVEIHKKLCDLVEHGKIQGKVILLTGRMRPLDQASTIASKMAHVMPENATSEGNTYVVATQAVEIGVGVSFDYLISECAPMDSLVHRFGRLDSQGVSEASQKQVRGVILGGKHDEYDHIYGKALTLTWYYLNIKATNETVDFGHLSGLRDKMPDMCFSNNVFERAPLLLEHMVENWVQTSPGTVHRHSVFPFIRGTERIGKPNTEVSVIWRKHISVEMMHKIPPREEECLEIPLDSVLGWLSGNVADGLADAGHPEPVVAGAGMYVKVYVWNRHARELTSKYLADLGKGDIIVLPSEHGGLWQGCWDPTSVEPVSDLGDQAQVEYHDVLVLRLDPELHEGLPSFSRIADEGSRLARAWVETIQRSNILSEELKLILSRMNPRTAKVESVPSTANKTVLVLSAKHKEFPRPIFSITDGSDKSMSDTGAGTLLPAHLSGVADIAFRLASQLGFPAEISHDIRLAGELHDIGKAYSRFQESLIVDEFQLEYVLAGDETPVAKSTHRGQAKWKFSKEWRHEIASLLMAESNSSVLAQADNPDLVKHLILTHHGLGRPWIQVAPGESSEKISYQYGDQMLTADADFSDSSALAVEAAERFWRLSEQFGHWGLAWLEAVLRLADYMQTAKEKAEC